MAEEDGKKIEIYREAIKKEDRVSEEEYEERLTRCKQCELLNAGTCGACGCYVELRATARAGHCPQKKPVTPDKGSGGFFVTDGQIISFSR